MWWLVWVYMIFVYLSIRDCLSMVTLYSNVWFSNNFLLCMRWCMCEGVYVCATGVCMHVGVRAYLSAYVYDMRRCAIVRACVGVRVCASHTL